MNAVNNLKVKSTSSSYREPKIDLDTCLDKINKLIKQNGTTQIYTDQQIRNAFQYTTNSGWGGYIITAMKYYGLLTNISTNKWKVSHQAAAIFSSKTITKADIYTLLLNVPINKKIFSIYNFHSLPDQAKILQTLISSCEYSIKKANAYLVIFYKNLDLYHSTSAGSNALSNPLKSNSNASADFSCSLSNGSKFTITAPNDMSGLLPHDFQNIKALLDMMISKVAV